MLKNVDYKITHKFALQFWYLSNALILRVHALDTSKSQRVCIILCKFTAKVNMQLLICNYHFTWLLFDNYKEILNRKCIAHSYFIGSFIQMFRSQYFTPIFKKMWKGHLQFNELLSYFAQSFSPILFSINYNHWHYWCHNNYLSTHNSNSPLHDAHSFYFKYKFPLLLKWFLCTILNANNYNATFRFYSTIV